jgi:protoporphyrinogen/coproporphyrinogen III oxidase
MKAIVIGAGPAGLAAADQLIRNSVETLCLEEKPFAGGRVFSLKRDGFIIDAGAQFFFNNYETCLRLCSANGLADEIKPFANRTGLPDGKGRLSPVLVSIKPTDLWKEKFNLLRFKGVPYKAMLQILPVLPVILKNFKHYSFTDFNEMLKYDNISFSELVTTLHCRAALEYVFQPVISCLTLGEPEDVSAAYGLALVYNFFQGLLTLKNGIGSLTAALYEANKQSIKLSTPVYKIIVERNMVKGVEAAGGFIEADHVICTAPAPVVLNMLSAVPGNMKSTLEKVKYSQCCHVVFGVQKKVMPEGWYAAALPRVTVSTMAGFTDSSVKSENYAPQGTGLINCFTFSRHGAEMNARPDDEVKRLLIDEIRGYFPQMPKEPLFTEIFRFREAVCSSPAGMLSAIDRMKKAQPLIGGFYPAGEYMNMPSVEGSVKSGIDAAKAVIRSLQ